LLQKNESLLEKRQRIARQNSRAGGPKGGLARTKHGAAGRGKELPEYVIWEGMKGRCSPSSKGKLRRLYFGRGIRVCEQWASSFENFFADMGPRPSRKHSIDRFPNNDGNYEPGNCRWATQAEQHANRSVTRRVSFDGEQLLLPELAERLGLTYTALEARLRRGWSESDLRNGKKHRNSATGDRSGSHTHPEKVVRGSAHRMARLTEESVREIRRTYAAGGVRHVDLANRYGVSKGTIGFVLRGETWRHAC
jgi:hypothetical protein